MPGYTFKDSHHIIHIDMPYGKMTEKRMVRLLNGNKLGYMDFQDLAERAWKAGCRTRKIDGKYKWFTMEQLRKKSKPQGYGG